MLYKVSNNIDDIDNLLYQLKKIYKDYSFISFIDGEYGIRVRIYNSIVKLFYNNCKQKSTVVAICFLNNKSFLHNCCDHIIEIQDTILDEHSFDRDYPKNLAYDTYKSTTKKNIYETMIEKHNFTNIFFSLHSCGSHYINKFNNKCYYKLENKFIETPNIAKFIIFEANINQIPYNLTVFKNIAIWIRKSYKHPTRDMPSSVYNEVFNFCIHNKINCYFFMDINEITIPNNPYIINATKRHHNKPDFDNFLNILNNCDFYIGSDSGSTEFALAYSNTRVLYTSKNDYQGILIKKRKNQADNKYNITLLKNFYDIST
jgi:hypothetical protein